MIKGVLRSCLVLMPYQWHKTWSRCTTRCKKTGALHAPTTFGAAAELHGACDHLYKDGDKTIVGEGKDKREDIYDAVASDLTTHPVRWLNTMKIHQNVNSLFALACTRAINALRAGATTPGASRTEDTACVTELRLRLTWPAVVRLAAATTLTLRFIPYELSPFPCALLSPMHPHYDQCPYSCRVASQRHQLYAQLLSCQSVSCYHPYVASGGVSSPD